VPHHDSAAPARSLSSSAPAPAAPGIEGLDPGWVARTVTTALDEDLGGDPGRDVTTQATLARDAVRTGALVAREPGVVAGLVMVEEVLAQAAARLGLGPVEVVWDRRDGDRVVRGDRLATLTGPAQVILVAERTLLNLASRASGVATATRAWADVLDAAPRDDGSRALVLDTRKTMPGLRPLDKYAVRCGGGTNKRMGLYDVAMIKDNHIAAAGSLAAAISRVRERFPDVPVQVEADTTEQALEAVASGADFLLLDNMPDDVLAATVAAVRRAEREGVAPGRVELEATGNLTLERAASVAATGVDHLSVGALTHSARVLDLALDL